MDNWLIICNFVISRYLLLKSGYMVYLKEDGSLDIERIRKLPIEERAKMVSSFNDNQLKYYVSKFPINESKQPIKAVVVDYTMEDEKRRGTGVDADEFFNKMRKKYLESR